MAVLIDTVTTGFRSTADDRPLLFVARRPPLAQAQACSPMLSSDDECRPPLWEPRLELPKLPSHLHLHYLTLYQHRLSFLAESKPPHLKKGPSICLHTQTLPNRTINQTSPPWMRLPPSTMLWCWAPVCATLPVPVPVSPSLHMHAAYAGH